MIICYKHIHLTKLTLFVFAHREKFPNAKVPTLEQAIELSLDLGLKIYFDVKGNAAKVCI